MLHIIVNIAGVIAATIVGLIFGFIWYSPTLFGKAWAKSITSKGGRMPKMNAFGLVMIIVSSFITALLLDVVISLAGVTTVNQALLVAGIVWLGFFFSKEIVSAAMRHHGNMLAINGFHDLIVLLLMAAVIIVI